MQESSNCQNDYIEFKDGDRDTSNQIGRYCSSAIPSRIQSTGNQMYVKFITDGSNHYSGFKAIFRKGNFHINNIFPGRLC